MLTRWSRRRAREAVVLLAVAVTACSCAVLGRGEPDRISKIDSLRSDRDHLGLVAVYLGGACDGPARLAATETSTRIELSVIIRSGQNGTACSTSGIIQTAAVRLSEPIGARSIWSENRQLIPFDGARLLTPRALPPLFSMTRESGERPDTEAPSPAPQETTAWTTGYQQPQSNSNDQCNPTRGQLEITVGRRGKVKPGVDWAKVASTPLGDAMATLWREGSATEPTGISYIWTTKRDAVRITSQQGCGGDQILSRDELLRVAESLESG